MTLLTNNIFLTFTRDGPGHYDAVADLSDGEKCEKSESNKKIECTCGMTRKDATDSCIDREAPNGRKYSSCCPCLKNSKGCGNFCRCRACKNPLGRATKEVPDGKRIRQRAKTDTGGERKDGSSYMKEHNENITHGRWTDEENFIFLQHVVLSPDLLTNDLNDITLQELPEAFNASIQDVGTVLKNNSYAKSKTKIQIKNKLQTVKKKKELAYRILEEQLQQFLRQVNAGAEE